MGQTKYTPTCVKFQGDMMREERVRACMYFARPAIAIAKIRDYLESTRSMVFEPFWSGNGYRI